ncbi:MAG: hypothetical protein AB1607_11435 [Chloroflexota bacterium]
MDYLFLTLRIVHILAGLFWVGGTLMMTFFIAPTVGALGEAGPRFVAHLVRNLKFTTRMSIAAGLTALAGIWLYWIDSNGFEAPWMMSSVGTGFGIGSAFGAIGFIFGILIGRTTNALVQLGGQIQGKPTPEQFAQLQLLQRRQAAYSKITAVSLILAVIFMAAARFLVF